MQLEKNQHVVVRLAQFPAVPERRREGGGMFGMARRQGGREQRPQAGVVGGVGQHEDVDAQRGMPFQQRSQSVGKTLFQRGRGGERMAGQ